MDFFSYAGKMKRYALLSLVLLIITIISVAYFVLFLIEKSHLCIYFLLALIVLIAYQIYLYKWGYFADNDGTGAFEITINAPSGYSQVLSALEKNSMGVFFEFSEDSAFFRIKSKYTVRCLLYRTADFNKKEYDSEKKKINKKANKIYNISQQTSLFEQNRLMRVNLIYADLANQTLWDYITGDVGVYLNRVEGILPLVIHNGKLIVPRLYKTIYVSAINRYSDTVKMLLDIIESN